MLLIVILLAVAGWRTVVDTLWSLRPVGRPADLEIQRDRRVAVERRPESHVVGYWDQLRDHARVLSSRILGRSRSGPCDGPFGYCLMKPGGRHAPSLPACRA